MRDPSQPRPDFDAVPVKPAATVMLIRDAQIEAVPGEGPGIPEPGIAKPGIPRPGIPKPGIPKPGIEVFMLRRTLGAASGGGMYVFPGGRVEQSDGEDTDHAHRVAAIRECFEEAGVLLALDADGRHVADGHRALDARQSVYDGSVDILELCAAHGVEPAVDELAWVSHWITPAGETPRRFDTRFYVVAAPPEQASTHDDNETIDSLWVRPSEAIGRQMTGELTMMPPTVANLEFLARFDSVEDAMAESHRMPTPPCILPKLRTDGAGQRAGVALPHDADYDSLD